MHINPDWLYMKSLKKQKLLSDAIKLNEVKIDAEIDEIGPKIACGHQDEEYCYNTHIMELAHTISDALDGQLRHLLLDTLNMKCYYYDIDEGKLGMLFSEVNEIYAKGYNDGVEDERERIKAGKQM